MNLHKLLITSLKVAFVPIKIFDETPQENAVRYLTSVYI